MSDPWDLVLATGTSGDCEAGNLAERHARLIVISVTALAAIRT
jgi:hypothetical protein